MTSREPFSFERLHPKAREHFALMAHRLEQRYKAGLTPTLFKPFEGFRTPERQDYLFRVEKTTKARGWQSAHNYGLAVDFVPLKDAANLSSWDWHERHDWTLIRDIAVNLGLSAPISWDLPHVEHPAWQAIKGHVI